jgi:maleate cis-trans isomerase
MKATVLDSTALIFLDCAALRTAELVEGLHGTIGEPLLTAYTAVKRHEAEHFRDATLDSERRMLWHRY